MDKYQQTIETFNNVAEQYWEKFKDFPLYKNSYDRFCEHLPDTSCDLLEVACGPGHVSQYLLRKKPKIELLGIDLAPKMIQLAQKNNPLARYLVLDCRQLSRIEQTFDAIMCGFCLPYISWQDSQALINDMSQLLNSGGKLYLSTTESIKKHELQKSKTSPGAVYLQYHDIDAIKACLKQAGFTLIELDRITHIHNQKPTSDVFILAQKM